MEGAALAGKYALYLPYKIHDALSRGNITDTEYREFITALFDYDRNGTEPAFSNSGLLMLFESIRPEIDFYHDKYNALIEKRRNAGKKGEASASEAKAGAARENGSVGGAPEGNRNAAGNRGGAPKGNRNAAKGNPAPEAGTENNSTQAESVISIQNQKIETVVVVPPPLGAARLFWKNNHHKQPPPFLKFKNSLRHQNPLVSPWTSRQRRKSSKKIIFPPHGTMAVSISRNI
jgi:hypothetical protein